MIEKVCFVSVSGGKDSTLTLALALEKYKGTDIPVVAVFADTNWEHPATYRYLKQLETFFGIKIYRICGFEGGLPALIRKKTIFPSPRRRYCTQILKTEIQRKFYESFYFSFPFKLAEVWIGIRKEESVARRNTKDFLLKVGQKTRFGEKYPFDIFFRYPIKDLTEREVFKELKNRNIPINPLYERGFKRVGCFPCFISKKDIIDVLCMAFEGDTFAKNRVKQMVDLDKDVDGKFHIDAELTDIIKQAKQKFEFQKAQLKLF
jgi:3'-phosphoadenosine 5'-phosphosulfate sulfotransferase (PAPS reductase)/FAD synthetase